MNHARFQEAIRKLRSEAASENFTIHYTLRNPPDGVGAGSDGVADQRIIETYIKALELAHSVMASPPFHRAGHLATDCTKRTDAFIVDILSITAGYLGFVHHHGDEVPFIVLPSRILESTRELEEMHAKAVAVHEVVHAFNNRERTLGTAESRLWRWYDEAMAVFVQTCVLADNPCWLRLVANWVDLPSACLDDDHPQAEYQAVLFLHYLASEFGPGFISDVWTQSDPYELPLGALERLIAAKGEMFSSADPHVDDVFRRYCLDSYFPLDAGTNNYAKAVFDRFHGRSVQHSFSLDKGGLIEEVDSLDHLSCRYYRVYLSGGVARAKVTLDRNLGSPLKVEVATVKPDQTRGTVVRLLPGTVSKRSNWETLSGTIHGSDLEGIDHLVVVVTNCGYRSDPNGQDFDGQRYTLRATAE